MKIDQDINETMTEGVTTIDANQTTAIGIIDNATIRAQDRIHTEVVDLVHMVATVADDKTALAGEVTEATLKAATGGIQLHNEIQETTHTDELQVHPRGTIPRRDHHHPRVDKAVCA